MRAVQLDCRYVVVIRCLYVIFGIDAKASFIQNIIGELERPAPLFLDYQCAYLSGKQQVYREYPERIHYYAIWSEGNREKKIAEFQWKQCLKAIPVIGVNIRTCSCGLIKPLQRPTRHCWQGTDRVCDSCARSIF